MNLPTLPTLIHQEKQRNRAFERAKELSNNKGIVNLGAGIHRNLFAYSVAHSPEVTLNTDLKPDGVTNFITLNLEETPYPFGDKEFDVAFASHIIEHLNNWKGALEEMERIADWVVIALPHPSDLFAALNPAHKQHFTVKDIEALQKDNVLIYY